MKVYKKIKLNLGETKNNFILGKPMMVKNRNKLSHAFLV